MCHNVHLLSQKSQLKSLLRFLTIKLASVLVKVKPAVLVGLCSQKDGCDYQELWRKNKDTIISMLGVSCRELKTSKQLLFYDSHLLADRLNDIAHKRFLYEFGYLSCKELDDYLDLLTKRFNSAHFPHEIGIFLGYPLKDVKGFLQKPPIEPVELGRWKVFGEAEPSLHFMRIYRKSENLFGEIIEKQLNPLLFIDHLNKYFQKMMLEGAEKKSFFIQKV